ncbi:tetratricopeptide repeat protein [Aliifodinibius sp. S!AR15-10]|uniref:tetratricopeptide repeat protein n=1 Tax=Aliifodinibius sp. S!AR15-10 TaxID=2950437 RepID=UPI002860BA8E|nr:tetratricopeptide repeat protein [Aliifodinibius sp. S!AR15-10]MDR8393105.1 tetratricopeptide repeat protein [Aliifodinibius sp. S!AR15-10]
MTSIRNLCSYFLIITFFLIPVIVSGQQVFDSPENLYQKGVNLFDRGLYEKSAGLLDQFGTEYPDHKLRRSAEFYRARAQARLDSTSKKHAYEAYIKEYPNTAFARKLFFELANEAEADSNFTGALSYYERSLQHQPTDKEAAQIYYWLAEASVSNGNNQQARNYFMQLADRYPDSEWAPKALYSRGRLYLSDSKFDSSSVAFEVLKDRYPNHEMTRRIGTALGESYYQQGKYKQAIEALQNSMPYLDDEMRSKAVYLVAESHNYLNNFDEASKFYLQYINMNKGTDRVRIAHYGLGWVYHKQQIYHWAADSFEKAAQGDDETARKALYYKAVNEKLGGRYDQAIETFRTFGDRYQEGLWVEEAYYEWAITAYEMGIYAETIETLLSIVRGEDNLDWAGKVYTLLGEAYFANKEYTRALQAFEEAEQLTNIDDSVKRQARFQKAWVQYRNQAYEQAQPTFESVYNEAPNSDLGAEALFWSADSYFNMGRFGSASDRFGAFVNRYPEHELAGAARYSLGWSYFNNGAYQNAIEPFNTFLAQYEPPPIALYPYDTDATLRLGDSYYASHRYEDAIETYKKSIGAEPGGDYAMFQVANSYYRADQTYEAVTTFRRLLRIYPYSRLREQAQYNIAYIYLNTGNYTQAINEFRTAINKYPNTSWAARSQYNIGDAYYNAGDFEKAVEAYKKVLEEYPQSDYLIEAINGIQYAQLSSGQQDSSSAILEDFLGDHPQSTTADRLRYRQAENLYQSGDYPGAINEFRQYIRITNNQDLLPEAHFSLANAYEQTQKVNQAIESYQTIVENYPDSEQLGPALVALARIYFDRSDYSTSFDYYNKLLEERKDFSLEALAGMGKTQLAMGNVDAAEQHFNAALKVNSDYDPAKVGLGKIALRNGNYSEATDQFALVAESNTTEIGAEAQYLLGQTQQQQQNYNEALDAYSNVSVLYEAFDEWVAKALLRSAECHIQLGNTGEARSTLNSIVENYPGMQEAQKAQQMLNSN